ncbi:hypothetical protein MKX03_029116, partial [Papaver bracteatum]
MGRPLMTATDDTNPWWGVLEKAIVFVELGIPIFGSSPMMNTPFLLHEDNE